MKINDNLKNTLSKYPWTSPGIKLKSKIISPTDFVLKVLELEKIKEVADFYGVSTVTVTNNIKKYLPELSSPTGGHLYARILNLVKHKKCYKCNEIKAFEEMYTRNGTADYMCKECGEGYRQTEGHKKLNKAKEAARRARKLKRTPKWANMQEIQAIYDNCPKGYHVDHILPLKGKFVSGLHVESNLQYLEAKENISKSNKFIPK